MLKRAMEGKSALLQPMIYAFLVGLAFVGVPANSFGQESDTDTPSANKPGAPNVRKGRPPRTTPKKVPVNRGLLRVKDLKKSVGALPGNRSKARKGNAASAEADNRNSPSQSKKGGEDDKSLLKKMKSSKSKDDDSPWNKVNIPDEMATGIEFKRPRKGTRFSFNLVDTDLIELVKIMGNITGKAFILGGKAPHIKATIYAPTKITAAEAYQAFLSVLQVNGLTVVPAGRYLKILPIGGSTQRNNPILMGRRKVPPGDQIVTRIHALEHVAAEEIAGVLDRFKSPEGDITVYGPSNTLIITDYGSSIRRLTKLLKLLDAPGTGEQVWIEPVNHADATDMASRILEIFDTGSSTGGAKKPSRPKKRGKKSSAPVAAVVGEQAPDTKISKILPDERTNSLVIVSSESAYLRILELLKRLDVPVAGDGTLHVHKLQHADAEELAKTLNNLSKGSSRRSSGAKGRGGADSSASLFEGEVQISADKATNSIVVVSSLRDYMSLKSVIDKLDVMQRQVYVEAVIMEVSLDKNRDLGFAMHSGNMVGSGDDKSLIFGSSQPNSDLSSLLLSPGLMSGLAAGLRGPEIEGTEDLLGAGISIPAFGVALQALQTNSDANVLSTPHILATDNTEASITVGKNVPMQQGYNPMGQVLSQMAGSAGVAGQAATGMASMMGGMGGMGGFSIGRQNVGLTLAITPHINDDDQVRLEIKLEISDVSSITEGLGPNISKKNANTTSVVSDQQTIVIGGLITDNVVETTQKVPLLGDIPILGFFFRHKKSLVEKRNLLIFLTPYIIRSSEDFREIFNRKMAERREFIERWTAFEYHRVDPHLDWSRTNGAVSEINRVVSTAQDDETMRLLSEAQTDIDHTPKSPVFFPKSALKALENNQRKGGGVPAGPQSGDTIIDGRLPDKEAEPGVTDTNKRSQ